MARLENETKRYLTWFPYIIDSKRWRRQGWHVSKKERIPPKLKLLAPLSLAFPVLHVTYERIVAGGMRYPEEYRMAKQLASEMLSRDPDLAHDPSLAAFFVSTREEPIPPETPLSSDSSPASPVPPMERPIPPPSTPADVRGHETKQQGSSQSSLLQPPPPPPPKIPRESI